MSRVIPSAKDSIAAVQGQVQYSHSSPHDAHRAGRLHKFRNKFTRVTSSDGNTAYISTPPPLDTPHILYRSPAMSHVVLPNGCTMCVLVHREGAVR